MDNCVTWNEIHHKTEWQNYSGHGYPDPDYLDRVTDELAAQGVTDSTDVWKLLLILCGKWSSNFSLRLHKSCVFKIKINIHVIFKQFWNYLVIYQIH